MRTSITTLALLLLLAAPLAADRAGGDVPRIRFADLELRIADAGQTGLEPGRYRLSFDRARVAPGGRVGARLTPVGGQPDSIWLDLGQPVLQGCETTGDEGSPSFGPRSRSAASPAAGGGLALQVWAEDRPGCSLRLVVPVAGGGGRGGGPGGMTTQVDPPQAPPRFPPDDGSPQPDEPAPTHPTGLTNPTAPPPPPTGPGGLTTGERPPECAPPRFPPDDGSPQPSAVEPGLTATPVDPPDAGCELTGFPPRGRLQAVEDPALRSALLALRGEVERMSRLRRGDARSVATARGRIRRQLSRISAAARGGASADLVDRCAGDRSRCERACGGRDCCCCTAGFASCLAAP